MAKRGRKPFVPSSQQAAALKRLAVLNKSIKIARRERNVLIVRLYAQGVTWAAMGKAMKMTGTGAYYLIRGGGMRVRQPEG